MPKAEIICLANSRKRSGRCVAGLRTDGGGWVRLLGSGPEGELHFPAYAVDAGGPVQVLDVIMVDLRRPAPQPHQPENWRVGPALPELVARPGCRDLVPLVLRAVDAGPALLGDTSPRTEWDHYAAWPAPASLALVAPKDLSWRIRQAETGRLQVRACFRLAAATYDLPLTDPAWEQRLARAPEGDHPRAAAGIPDGDRVLLTVSLGEPYNGFCYKLAAAVIVVPGAWRGRGAGG